MIISRPLRQRRPGVPLHTCRHVELSCGTRGEQYDRAEGDFVQYADGDGLFKKQVAPRTISAGMAYVKNRVTLAADVVDITSAFTNTQYRLGAEMRLPLGLNLRGGFNSHTGLTAGFGVGSFGIAYSKETPIMLSEAVTF